MFLYAQLSKLIMPTFTAPYNDPSAWTTSGSSITIASNKATFDCDPNSSSDTSYAEVDTGTSFDTSWVLNITFNMETNPNGGLPNPPYGGEGMWCCLSDTGGNPSSSSGDRIALGIYGNKAAIWYSDNSSSMSLGSSIDISPATEYTAVLSRSGTTVTLEVNSSTVTQTIPSLASMTKFLHATRSVTGSGQTYTGYYSSVTTGSVPGSSSTLLPPPVAWI